MFNTAGLEEVVLRHTKPPPGPKTKENKPFVEYRGMLSLATDKLYTCIPKEIKHDYAHFREPNKLWARLKEEYSTKTPNLYLQRCGKLDKTSIAISRGDIDVYIANFRAAWTKMKSIRDHISEDDEKTA
jgi:hypothetical protein